MRRASRSLQLLLVVLSALSSAACSDGESVVTVALAPDTESALLAYRRNGDVGVIAFGRDEPVSLEGAGIDTSELTILAPRPVRGLRPHIIGCKRADRR